MKKYLTALVLVLVPAVTLAQDGGRRGGMRMGGPAFGRNVVALMIEKKAELSLTNEQVAKLEPIAKKLEEQSKLNMDEFKKQRESGVRRSDLTEEQRTQLRANMEKLRGDREAALKEARAVLSEEQLQKLRSIAQDKRPARGGRRLQRG